MAAEVFGREALGWVPPSVPAILAQAAERAPDRPALVCGGTRLTYAQLSHAVDALATRLVARGVAGRPVALILSNSAALAIASWAVGRAGGIATALNPDYTAAELAPILADAEPALALVTTQLMASLAAALNGCATVEVGEDAAFVADLLADVPATLPMPDGDRLAALQFTGGTTGRAKGVALTHRAIATNVAQREARLPTEWADEVVVCCMPLFHSFALAMGLHLSAHCAGTLVLLPRYRPDWLLDAVEREGGTRLPAGPTVFNSLLGFDGLTRDRVASLRCGYSGSAPLSVDTLTRWQARTAVPIHEGYGQTEAGPILTYGGPDAPAPPGTVGRALPGTELRIADPDQAGAGEICARGPQIMAGYRGLPEETAAALKQDWLHTGDVGRLDADGTLTILDRLKDMAIVGGYNVYPREVDEALVAHPGVAQAAVVAVPDAYRGEALHAFVVANVDQDALTAWCEERLVRYKRPSALHHLDALPLTAVGKIDRAALRALAKETADVA